MRNCLILYRWLFICLLILVHVSCRQEKDDPTPSAHYRVVKAVQTAFDGNLTTTYQYDNQNRLSTVTEYPVVADTFAKAVPTAQHIVHYDATPPTYLDYTDRKLTKPELDGGELVYGSRRRFVYDTQGRIAIVSELKALANFQSFRLTQTFQYEYGPDNLPAALIISGVAPLSERNVYVYNFLNGNAVHVKLTITNARSSEPTFFEYDVQFDNAPGVYTNFFALYPGITSFNKNNLINTSTTHFHDERGLLVKRVKKGNYIDDVTTYTYETY
ncbi:hypothetical protein [Spirosoma validum]|uniref:YD repeat-containing protein n=1 Tax=Spirosoma validum TaxID=2771355 RepID=A0A927AZK1_9BACT|nr:hypothetical protein [Spirosoma validum]MBD2752780.1 hypothetical protein [Spirosoma validum]